MINGRSDSRNRLAWTMIASLGLVATGCGDGTTTAPAKSDVTSTTATPPEASKPTTAKPSGRGQALSPGGDLDRRERKAQKAKEKASSSP
jgi:hypothetical protein